MFETVPRPSATHKVAGLDVVWVLGLDGGINCIPPYKKQDLTPLLEKCLEDERGDTREQQA